MSARIRPRSRTILAGHSPAGMAAVPDYLFVTNSDSGDVTVIYIDSRRVIARIPVGQDPQEVVITPDNQYALVLNRKSGDVAVIRIPAIIEWGNHHNKTAPLFTIVPVGCSPGQRSHQPNLTNARHNETNLCSSHVDRHRRRGGLLPGRHRSQSRRTYQQHLAGDGGGLHLPHRLPLLRANSSPRA